MTQCSSCRKGPAAGRSVIGLGSDSYICTDCVLSMVPIAVEAKAGLNSLCPGAHHERIEQELKGVISRLQSGDPVLKPLPLIREERSFAPCAQVPLQ